MIKLSIRLQTIADLINKEDKVIDVGCDHGYLGIYLYLKNKNYVLSSDINSNVIKNTKKNLKKFNLESKIEVVCSEGLNALNNEINTIVISGLGFQTILNILNADLLNVKKIIIQSNNGSKEIRKFLMKKGFYIKDEKIVKDKSFFYIIILFEKGKKKYSKKELEFGPILLQNKDKLFIEKYKQILKKNKEILKKLNKKNIIKIIEIKYKTRKLKKILNI